MSALRELGEFGLITRLTRDFPLSEAVVQGVGDDCAVLRCGHRLLLATCDASLEEVHFSRVHSPPEDIGWRAAASALSDIAAMGGKPTFVLITLACPEDTPLDFVDALYGGMSKAVAACGALIVGGDTTRSRHGLAIDVLVLGEATDDRPILRGGALPGDYVLVTGYPGSSAAGLSALQQGVAAPELVRAHLHPLPRIEAGQWLARCTEVHAMADISDGLLRDGGHLAQASGLTMDLEAQAIPIHPELVRLADTLGLDPLDISLTGGEAYELVFTVAGAAVDDLLAAFRTAFPDLPCTCVGRCLTGSPQVLIDGQVPTPGGHDHFA